MTYTKLDSKVLQKMSRIHEGEIIIKESFGSTPKERLYIRPPGQTETVLVKWGETNSPNDWLQRIFLPQGYPDSVSKDYLSYQIWDTAQAFCSTIAGILATQEVLRGVGVGDVNASPLAATITWILKDGCGHIGRILFAYTHGTFLDAYSKKWRMYADILNNAAMCIEIALPLFKMYTSFALCISTVMKAIVGVAGGATRVAMTQHHAIIGNLADVSAKDAAQETAVNLIASVTALLILITAGNSLLLFMMMMVLHVMCNYFAVRAVCLRTLNEPRFLLAIDQYLRREVIATPCEINKTEPIIFYQLGPCILDLKLSGFRIKLGQSLIKVFSETPVASHLVKLSEIYEFRNYILVPNIQTRNMHVLLKDGASVDDVLCAYLHATLLAIVTCAINDEPLPVYKNQDQRPFAQVCHTLQSVEWSRHEAHIPNCRFAYHPSYEVMKYLDKIVQNEWPRVCAGLNATGWDLSKHLLICEQWRINRSKIHVKHISAEIMNEEIQFDSFAEAFANHSFGDILEEQAESGRSNPPCTIEPESTLSKQQRSAPKPQSSVRKLETSKPELSLPKPESYLPKPESYLPKPESSLPKPESYLPKLGSSFPKTESSLPKSESSPPVPESYLPKPESSFPKPESSFPKPELSLPKSESPLPKLESSLPKLESSLPNPETNSEPSLTGLAIRCQSNSNLQQKTNHLGLKSLSKNTK